MNTLTINDIYTLLSNLDKDDKRWLVDRLLDDISNTPAADAAPRLVYPKISKDFEVSDSVKSLTMKSVSVDFDFEDETDKCGRRWQNEIVL